MSAARGMACRGSAPSPERAQDRAGGVAAEDGQVRPHALEDVPQRRSGAVAASLARLAEFAARRAELAAEEAEYLAELARTADTGLAAPADPSVHASVTTGFDPAPPEPCEYLTQATLGELIGAHPRTVRRMELAGELPDAIEIGRLKRWRRSTVQSWLDEGCPKPRRKRR